MADQPNTQAVAPDSSAATLAETATTPQPPATSEAKPPAAAQNTDTTASETAATTDHMIPKARFDDINSQLKEAKKQIAEIEKTKAEAAKAQAAAEEAAAKEQGKWQELYQAEQAKREAIEAERADAVARAEAEALRNLKYRIAAKHGLPELWFDRLQGGNEEELIADAQALADTITKPPVYTGTDARAGTNPGQPVPELSEAEIIERAARLGVNAADLKAHYEQQRIQQQ